MCYHGAFVTGKSLHEEHWIDLGGGALKQGFCLAQRDVTLPSNAKADTALTEYTVSGSRTVLSMESTGLQVIRTKSPILLTKITLNIHGSA